MKDPIIKALIAASIILLVAAVALLLPVFSGNTQKGNVSAQQQKDIKQDNNAPAAGALGTVTANNESAGYDHLTANYSDGYGNNYKAETSYSLVSQ